MDPTPSQAEQLASHCGAARVAFNVMLAAVKANLDQRAAEKSYDLDDDALTPALGWSAFALQREWLLRRDVAAPWWAENSKHVYQAGCVRLAHALTNWARSRKAGSTGPRSGFPRFKSKHRTTPSCAFSDGVRLSADRRHVVLPRIGSVRLHHSTRKLARRIESGTARITGTTVSYRRGRWQVAFTVRVMRTLGRPAHVKAGAPVIGVDLGVRDLIVAATPDGREVARIAAPRALADAQTKLRRLQRKAARQHGPYDQAAKARREPSAEWRRTQADIARVHHRVANLRANHLHNATARLTRAHDVIGLETLAPKAMASAGGRRKRGLNRALADAAFGELNRQLDYKATWYGVTLVRAGRFYPSSKTCSTCGAVKAKLPLNIRTYECETCGLVLDRDLNAAINLAKHATASLISEAAAEASPDPLAGFVTGGATQKTPPAAAGRAAGVETGTHDGHLVVAGGSVRRKA